MTKVAQFSRDPTVLTGVHAVSTASVKFSPNSASCERVFALLKSMFTEEQYSSLADHVSSALKLRYNGRSIG